MVQSNNVLTQPFPLALASAAPGLFTADSSGVGQARALNSDGSPNGAGRPALSGSTLTLYATGEGQTSPAGMDGKVAGPVPPQPVLPVTVTMGGKQAVVRSAGGVSDVIAGVMQVTVTVPSGVTGQLPVVMTVGGVPAQNGVTVAIQ
jgi:uncharacterized protein (TIGR03437 family)